MGFGCYDCVQVGILYFISYRYFVKTYNIICEINMFELEFNKRSSLFASLVY